MKSHGNSILAIMQPPVKRMTSQNSQSMEQGRRVGWWIRLEYGEPTEKYSFLPLPTSGRCIFPKISTEISLVMTPSVE